MADEPHEEREFNGVHAVVTGGGTGIGAAIASELAAAGAVLTLIGRNEERLKQRCAESSMQKPAMPCSRSIWKYWETGLLAPAKTSAAIINLLNREVVRIANTAEVSWQGVLF